MSSAPRMNRLRNELTNHEGFVPARKHGRGLEWTENEVELLIKLYPNTSARRLSDIFNKSRQAIYMKAFDLGLAKSPEYLADPSKSGRFHGDSRPGGNPQNLIKNSAAPIGSVRLNRDGTFVVKFTDKHKRNHHRNWMPLLRFIWESAGRTVPEGQFVTFKEGRKTTEPDAITIDMLECVTMGEFSSRRQRQPRHIRQMESAIREILKEVQRAGRSQKGENQ